MRQLGLERFNVFWTGLLVAGYCAGCTPTAHPSAPAPRLQIQASAASDSVDLGPAPVREQRPEPTTSVRLWLDSNAATLAADGKLWLAARFVIPAEAHIYWSNPGESGLATQATFSGPPGFHLGPVHYPGPTRFAGERGAASYGYAGHTALLVSLTPPERVPTNAVLRVEASWLACSEVCARETASATLPWPPPAQELSSAPAISDYIRRLPKDPAAESVTVTRLTKNKFTIQAQPPVTLQEFFPETPLGPEDKDCKLELSQDGHAMTVELRTATPTESPINGVVRAQIENEEHFFNVNVPPLAP